MHASCHAWVGALVAREGLGGRAALEVGSMDVNGTVRDHFAGPYLGVDMAPGGGVDLVAEAEALPFPDGSWPVVVSTEMLEHVWRPWRVLAELGRVTAPGGHLVVTARGFDERGCWEVHAFPYDLWRFSGAGLGRMVEELGLAVVGIEVDPEGPGWFLHARRPRRP